MPVERPLLRPALVFERCLLGTHTEAGFAVARGTAAALREWRQLGYACLAVSCSAGSGLDPAGARAELARQRQIAAALRSYGVALDGIYVMPRPGEHVDVDVPRANLFARLLLEAAGRHRIDLPRSLCVFSSAEAAAGARIAGMPCVLLGDGAAAARAADYAVTDLAGVRALVAKERERRARHAGQNA